MTASRNGRFPPLWLGGCLLLLALAYLAVRAFETVRTVRGEATAADSVRQDGPQEPLDLVASLEEREAEILRADPGGRDPFRDPVRPAAPSPRREPAPAPPPRPVLRALLYDRVNPSAQISIGNQVSDWLRQGDAFHGWTILRIGPNSVTIDKDGDQYVLPSS